jgi:hypothetical protein
LKGLLFNSSLGGGEAGDGHAEWRAACVVHANLGAELNRARLTTMLTTDTATEIWTNLTTLLNSELDETAYTSLVENLEWVYLQNLLVEVYRQERSDIVAAVTEGHLSKVVSTE